MRGKVADPLRERTLRLEELGIDKEYPTLIQTLDACADIIDAEHARRMESCRRGIRKDFARYMRSVIDDYASGTARRNRNHAHRKVRLFESAMGRTTCGRCGQTIGPYDHYCRYCGAKLTGTDYEEENEQ